jgi:hypothetical protein
LAGGAEPDSAPPWTNPREPLDVDDDANVGPADALQVVNLLNTHGGPVHLQLHAPPADDGLAVERVLPAGTGTPVSEDPSAVVSTIGDVPADAAMGDAESESFFAAIPPYPDVNGNRWVTPLDALLVVNHLNQTASLPPQTALWIGEASLVNSAIAGRQSTRRHQQAVAMNDAGHAAVVFSGWNEADHDGVYLRRYAPDGRPPGPAVQVNATTQGHQDAASVAIDPAGAVVVVWEGLGPGDAQGVFARWYGPDGAPRGLPVRVNATAAGDQRRPAVAMAGDGSSLVVWDGAGGSDADGVFLRRFDAEGRPPGEDVRVNTFRDGVQARAAVAVNAAGQGVVVWESHHAETGSVVIDGRRFAPDGTPVGEPFRISPDTRASQQRPSVAIDGRGRFVAAWTGYDQDGSGWNIYARRFDTNAQPAGGEVRVNARVDGHQQAPSVALADDGTFVVTWDSPSADGQRREVRARAFAAGDAAAPEDVVIGSLDLRGTADVPLESPFATLAQTAPSVVLPAAARGRIVWTGSGAEDAHGVYWAELEAASPSCRFDAAFADWTLRRWDGSAASGRPVPVSGCPLSLAEQDSLLVTLETEFTVPQEQSAVRFRFAGLQFDTTDPQAMKDAFEVALVDDDGRPLVEPFAADRDALWNLGEVAEPAAGPGVQVDGATITVGLDGIPAGTAARLVFRLVNNDADTQTTVHITACELAAIAQRQHVPASLQDAPHVAASLRDANPGLRATRLRGGLAPDSRLTPC